MPNANGWSMIFLLKNFGVNTLCLQGFEGDSLLINEWFLFVFIGVFAKRTAVRAGVWLKARHKGFLTCPKTHTFYGYAKTCQMRMSG